MDKQERALRLRVFDILDAIRIATEAAEIGREAFEADQFRRLAAERALEIISEASRHLPAKFKEDYGDIDWAKMTAFGNIAGHAYHLIQEPLVWGIIADHLPPLRRACEQLYSAVKQPSDPWPAAKG